MWVELNCLMGLGERLKGLWKVIGRLAWGRLGRVERRHHRVCTILWWLLIRSVEMVCCFGCAQQSRHHAGEPNVLTHDSIRPPRPYLLVFSASFR